MVEILNMEQRSPEWYEARLGIPTASNFSAILSKGRSGAPSKTRLTYMYKLIGERMTGEIADQFDNAHMRRGREMEPEARAAYEFEQNVDVQPVGFCRNFGVGCSPDGFVGSDGLVEIKTALPHIMMPFVIAKTTGAEHTAQVQGQLWITERQWCDLVVYWPSMPMLIERIERDETYIGNLKAKVDEFLAEMDDLMASVGTGSVEAKAEPSALPVDLNNAAPVF